MRRIMLDLETLGVNAGCVVSQIGAVEFDDYEIISTFKVNIDIEDSVNKHGLKLEPRTLLWWFEQPEAARNAVFLQPACSLDFALGHLNSAFNWNDVEVWCNGASFDFPIIKHLFNVTKREMPWKYWNEMDFRTFKNLHKELYEELKVKPMLAHNGLEDATSQALTLQAILNRIKFGGNNGGNSNDLAA